MKVKWAGLAAAAVLVFGAGGANAAQTFNFSNALFSTGGTLTGSFTLNDQLTAITGFNIVSSANGVFTGYDYTTANSSATFSNGPTTTNFQFNGSQHQLAFTLFPLISSLGSTLGGGGSSSEFDGVNGSNNRFLSGSVVAAAVPEPATWGLMVLGMGALGGALRRRRKFSTTFA